MQGSKRTKTISKKLEDLGLEKLTNKTGKKWQNRTNRSMEQHIVQTIYRQLIFQQYQK